MTDQLLTQVMVFHAIRMHLICRQVDEYSHGNLYYSLEASSGDCDVAWSWIVLENMSVKLIGNYRKNNQTGHAILNVFYVNPGRAFQSLKIGADVDLNKTWA